MVHCYGTNMVGIRSLDADDAFRGFRFFILPLPLLESLEAKQPVAQYSELALFRHDITRWHQNVCLFTAHWQILQSASIHMKSTIRQSVRRPDRR